MMIIPFVITLRAEAPRLQGQLQLLVWGQMLVAVTGEVRHSSQLNPALQPPLLPLYDCTATQSCPAHVAADMLLNAVCVPLQIEPRPMPPPSRSRAFKQVPTIAPSLLPSCCLGAKCRCQVPCRRGWINCSCCCSLTMERLQTGALRAAAAGPLRRGWTLKTSSSCAAPAASSRRPSNSWPATPPCRTQQSRQAHASSAAGAVHGAPRAGRASGAHARMRAELAHVFAHAWSISMVPFMNALQPACRDMGACASLEGLPDGRCTWRARCDA